MKSTYVDLFDYASIFDGFSSLPRQSREGREWDLQIRIKVYHIAIPVHAEVERKKMYIYKQHKKETHKIYGVRKR